MKFKDIIEIMRPINDIIGSLTVIIGILNTWDGISIPMVIGNVILGVITYFFIAASGMIINDVYDYSIDLENRPTRPIPRGSISLKQARMLFIIILFVGILISIIHSFLFNLGILNIIIAIFFGFIGWLYAAWGKKSGFLGNIIVSISFSIGLIYGAVLNNSNIPLYIYCFFLTSFFLLLAREIVKGCEDIEGDKKEGVKTLAILMGFKKTLSISLIFQIVSILFFILPIFTNIINKTLFIISMSPGLIDVIYATILTLKSNQRKESFKKISLLLKIGSLLGLFAFLLASIYI